MADEEQGRGRESGINKIRHRISQGEEIKIIASVATGDGWLRWSPAARHSLSLSLYSF